MTDNLNGGITKGHGPSQQCLVLFYSVISG